MLRTSTVLHVAATNIALMLLCACGPEPSASGGFITERTTDLLSMANPDRFDHVFTNKKIKTILVDRATHPAVPSGEYSEEETVAGPYWSKWRPTVKYSATGEDGSWVTAAPGTYTLSFKRISVTYASNNSPYDTLTAWLQMSFEAKGYWQINIGRGVEYLEEEKDAASRMAASASTSSMARRKQPPPKSYRWFGSSTISFVAHAVNEELNIQIKPDGADSYQDIAKKEGPTNTLLVGQLVDLQVSTKGGAKLTKIKWTIPDKSFKDYSANNTTATLTRLKDKDRENTSIQFYWADAGDKEVQCEANDGDNKMTAKVTLHIKKPEVTFTATIGDVFVGEYMTGKQKSTRLILAKNDKGELPGITFIAKIQVPKGFEEGNWLFVQMVVQSKSTLMIEDKGKTVTYLLDTGNAKVLDTTYPYGTGGVAKNDIYPTGAKAGGVSDSPNMNLLAIPKLVQSSKDIGKFKMYILFQPKGKNSRPVPLATMDWEWKGVAIKEKEKWLLKKDSGSRTPPDELKSVETSDHPVWDKNITDFKYEKQK